VVTSQPEILDFEEEGMKNEGVEPLKKKEGAKIFCSFFFLQKKECIALILSFLFFFYCSDKALQFFFSKI
jgi:hypothetical protein